jgi:cell pole-organizing protein PopZ
MSEPKGAQGPTMEEILASIRKMVPDDEDGPASEGGRLSPDVAEPRELVLTQMLAEDGSLVRLAAPAAPESEGVLLLTEPAPPEPAAARAPLVTGETLEAFVRRALEPQIQAWLEAHLPAMVERMVQDVIDDMRRKSESDKPSP